MRKSIVAGVAAAAMAATAFIASPAQAVTENRTSSVSIETYYSKVEYGRKIGISTSVKDNTGASVYDGTVTLWSKTKGKDWKAVQTIEAGGFRLFADLKPAEHTTYRATYSGYAATTQYENNYTTSTSAESTVKVARKITSKKVKGKKFTVKGKVSPDFKKKKLVIKVAKKSKGKYKKFKTIKTDKKGVYKVSFPRTRGLRYYKIIVPADSRHGKTYASWWTSVY